MKDDYPLTREKKGRMIICTHTEKELTEGSLQPCTHTEKQSSIQLIPCHCKAETPNVFHIVASRLPTYLGTCCGETEAESETSLVELSQHIMYDSSSLASCLNRHLGKRSICHKLVG